MTQPQPEDMGQYWALLGKLPTPVFVHDFSRGGELSFLNCRASTTLSASDNHVGRFCGR
jgi:hypothetical protein